jgi:hypothetical protein
MTSSSTQQSMQSTSTSTVTTSRSLRDSLSIIKDHLPNKKRRITKSQTSSSNPTIQPELDDNTKRKDGHAAHVDFVEECHDHESKKDNGTKDGKDDKDCQFETSEEYKAQIKNCLNDMIPYLFSRSSQGNDNIQRTTPDNGTGKDDDKSNKVLTSDVNIQGKNKDQDNKVVTNDENIKENKDQEDKDQDNNVVVNDDNIQTKKKQQGKVVDEPSTSSKNSEYNVYLQQLKKLKKENDDIQKRKEKVTNRYANLVYKYEYGLNTVQKLNDLRFAPDNVMDVYDDIGNSLN